MLIKITYLSNVASTGANITDWYFDLYKVVLNHYQYMNHNNNNINNNDEGDGAPC